MPEKKPLVLNSNGNPERLQSTDFITAQEKLFAYSHSTASTAIGAGNTGEEVVASVLIPANTLGNNDEIEVIAEWQAAGSGGTKIYRVRLHTSAAAAGTIYGSSQSLTNTTLNYRQFTRISEKNSSNAQEGAVGGVGGFGNNTTNAFATSSLSTGSDMYIVFTSQKATGTDVVSLNNYSVKIIRG